jgi:methionyl-tRNA synthetase
MRCGWNLWSFPIHKELCNTFLSRVNANGLLSKRSSKQWYDTEAKRFLPDRLVRGTCPNPKCNSESAYSNECGQCGHQHKPHELKDPKSVVTGATPEMRDTMHWWLDMGAASETMRTWLLTKAKTWRPAVLAHVMDDLMHSVRFARELEDAYKAMKALLPNHKQKYTAGKQVLLQFENKADRALGEKALAAAAIPNEHADEWAQRSISREIAWGIPIEGEPELLGETLYVWPDSLIAPIAFTQVALKNRGDDSGEATRAELLA